MKPEKEKNNLNEENQNNQMDEIQENQVDQIQENQMDQIDENRVNQINQIDENQKEETGLKQGKNRKEEKEEESFGKELLSWMFTIAIALFLGWFLSKVVLFNANVPTTSMESTIMKGDNLIGFRLAYQFSEPERGDVVIFPYPDNTSVTYVKRIIGMPGDTVEVYDGKVYINGVVLDESKYLTVTTEGEFGPYVVPEDSYFMMGDNRNFSLDSRYWENKFVKKEDIIAKVIFRYYPSIGMIE